MATEPGAAEGGAAAEAPSVGVDADATPDIEATRAARAGQVRGGRARLGSRVGVARLGRHDDTIRLYGVVAA